jgi:hypothetical protein
MKVSYVLATAALLLLPLRLLTLKQFSRPDGVVCTMTLRIFGYRISVERSCHITRASYSCGLRGGSITINPIDCAHQ